MIVGYISSTILVCIYGQNYGRHQQKMFKVCQLTAIKQRLVWIPYPAAVFLWEGALMFF